MTTAYEELVRVLYSEKDRQAFEWAIGSALQLGPKKIVVIYGGTGTGKSTILKIVEKIFEGTSIAVVFEGAPAVEARDDHIFMSVDVLLNFEELEAMPDVILVSTSGRVHNPARYHQLVNAIYEDPDEIPLIAQACAKRFRDLGPTYYDHAIPNSIPEENSK